MKVKFALPMLLAAMVGSSGCKTIRGIEQWKCDNWGLCHFGIKPSHKNHAPSASDQHNGADDCGCKNEKSLLTENQTRAPSSWR